MSNYYEMYFSEEHGKPYFFHPESGNTMWEVPEGSLIADLTSESSK